MSVRTSPATSALRFTLCAGPGRNIQVSAAIPRGPCVFPDMLPVLHAVADALQDKACADLAGLGRSVTCHNGCHACCSHLVVLGEAEAIGLLRTLRTLPEDLRRRVAGRFQAALVRLEACGLLPRLLAVFTREAHDWRRVAEMQAAWWELALSCPFMEGGTCVIYAERPLICRQYAMTSPAEACRTPYGAGSALEKVLPAVDLAGAAAAFDGQLAHSSRVLPLQLCLLREAHLSRRAFPVLDPKPMLLRFLEFATAHYARRGNPVE